MTRETSIDCYEQIKAEGLLSKRRMEVYEMLFQHGAMTANEIVRKSKKVYPNTNASSFNARLSELKARGAIIEVGEKKDAVSGNNCFVWDLTDKLPTKPNKRETPKGKRVGQALTALEALYFDKDNDDAWVKVASLIKTI